MNILQNLVALDWSKIIELFFAAALSALFGWWLQRTLLKRQESFQLRVGKENEAFQEGIRQANEAFQKKLLEEQLDTQRKLGLMQSDTLRQIARDQMNWQSMLATRNRPTP